MVYEFKTFCLRPEFAWEGQGLVLFYSEPNSLSRPWPAYCLAG
jgi:hypothetical protein